MYLAQSQHETSAAGTKGKICSVCGQPVRLARTEPHPSFSNLEIRVFVCEECDRISSDVIRNG
jgi:C4-type Zn-finger protein